MQLLEQIEQRARERADEQFDLFLEELERQIAAPRAVERHRWTAEEVRLLLRSYCRPSVKKLRKAARRLMVSRFDTLIERWLEIMNLIGLSADGSGGYHRLHDMSEYQLGMIAESVEAIAPLLHFYYRQFQTAVNAEFKITRGLGRIL